MFYKDCRCLKIWRVVLVFLCCPVVSVQAGICPECRRDGYDETVGCLNLNCSLHDPRNIPLAEISAVIPNVAAYDEAGCGDAPARQNILLTALADCSLLQRKSDEQPQPPVDKPQPPEWVSGINQDSPRYVDDSDPEIDIPILGGELAAAQNLMNGYIQIEPGDDQDVPNMLAQYLILHGHQFLINYQVVSETEDSGVIDQIYIVEISSHGVMFVLSNVAEYWNNVAAVDHVDELIDDMFPGGFDPADGILAFYQHTQPAIAVNAGAGAGNEPDLDEDLQLTPTRNEALSPVDRDRTPTQEDPF